MCRRNERSRCGRKLCTRHIRRDLHWKSLQFISGHVKLFSMGPGILDAVETLCSRHMSLNGRRDMCRGSWDALGPTWDMCRGGLGPSWEHLGGFVDASSPAWLHFVAFLTRLGNINDLTRTCAGCLGSLLAKQIERTEFFGPILGPKLEANFAS